MGLNTGSKQFPGAAELEKALRDLGRNQAIIAG
jgi:hypothetical protein